MGKVSGRRGVARLTRCENVRSASASRERISGVGTRRARTYRNLLLRHHAHAVLAPDADGRDPHGLDRLERVLCKGTRGRKGTSAKRRFLHACGALGSDGGASEATGIRRRTDLVQATLGAEDGDVAVIPRAAAARHLGRSSRSRARDECRPVRPARFKKVTPRLANDRRRSERRAIARTDRASERDSLDRSSGKFIGCFTFNRPR